MGTLVKFVLLLLISACVQAQTATATDADSLNRLLQTEKQDTNRVKLLLQLGKSYFYSTPDTALMLGQQALLLSRQAGFATGEVQSLSLIAHAFSLMGNYPKALGLSLEVLKKA